MKGPSSERKRGIAPSPSPRLGTGVSRRTSTPNFTASSVGSRPCDHGSSLSFLHTSNASGSAGAAGVYGRLVVRDRPAAVSSTCSRLRRTASAARSRILGTHMRIAHQHGCIRACLPGAHFQAALVVVVVSAFALRHVAPGSGHVPRGKDVFHEMKCKRFIRKHGARERGALFRGQVLSRKPRCLLQSAHVKPPPHAYGIDLGPDLERRLARIPVP